MIVFRKIITLMKSFMGGIFKILEPMSVLLMYYMSMYMYFCSWPEQEPHSII